MGKYQVENAVNAAVAARILGVSDECIVSGINGVTIPARGEILREKPLVIVDGAHNIDGVEKFCDNVLSFARDRRRIVIFGALKTKNFKAMVEIAAKMSHVFIAVSPHADKNIDYHECLGAARGFCGQVKGFEDDLAALAYALGIAGENDVILILGSFYLAGDMKRKIDFLRK